jgi:hypothetical protein
VKITIAMTVLLLAVFWPLAADQPDDHPGPRMEVERTDLALRELSGLLEARQGATLGDLKVRDIRDLLAEASVRMQEVQFIGETRMLSFVMPGAGHFKAGDNGRGAAFMAGGVVATAGTLVGAYFLLPSRVRFDHLNYFEDSFQDIETAWKGRSFVDFLPSIGVLIGGVAVHGILGYFAAESATDVASEKIKQGDIRFEPYAAADRLGLKATWRR